MKDKPIIFSGESVRAILAGQKTVTRRIMKPQLEYPSFELSRLGADGMFSFWLVVDGDSCEAFRKPPALPGQRLWVREAWAIGVYRADISHSDQSFVPPGGRWRSPIFMPRGFSRIDIEVVSVRAERLQEITEEDAEREGIEGEEFYSSKHTWTGKRAAYFATRDRIHRLKRWSMVDSNPRVWRIEFRRIEARP